MFVFYATTVWMCFLENHTTPLQNVFIFSRLLDKEKSVWLEIEREGEGNILVKNIGRQSKYLLYLYSLYPRT